MVRINAIGASMLSMSALIGDSSDSSDLCRNSVRQSNGDKEKEAKVTYTSTVAKTVHEIANGKAIGVSLVSMIC